MAIESCNAEVPAGRSGYSEALKAYTAGFLYRLSRDRGFSYCFFPLQLDSQAAALGVDDSNEILGRVDWPVIGLDYDVAGPDGFTCKRAIGVDAVDLKAASHRQRQTAIPDVHQAGEYYRQNQKSSEANTPDSIAHKIERQEKRGTFQTLDAYKWVVGQERRNDTTSEESKQGDVNGASFLVQTAGCCELNGPRSQSNEVGALRESDRMWGEYGIHQEQERDNELGGNEHARTARGSLKADIADQRANKSLDEASCRASGSMDLQR